MSYEAYEMLLVLRATEMKMNASASGSGMTRDEHKFFAEGMIIMIITELKKLKREELAHELGWKINKF